MSEHPPETAQDGPFMPPVMLGLRFAIITVVVVPLLLGFHGWHWLAALFVGQLTASGVFCVTVALYDLLRPRERGMQPSLRSERPSGA